jgi:hypothetical protein
LGGPHVLEATLVRYRKKVEKEKRTPSQNSYAYEADLSQRLSSNSINSNSMPVFPSLNVLFLPVATTFNMSLSTQVKSLISHIPLSPFPHLPNGDDSC